MLREAGRFEVESEVAPNSDVAAALIQVVAPACGKSSARVRVWDVRGGGQQVGLSERPADKSLTAVVIAARVGAHIPFNQRAGVNPEVVDAAPEGG